MDCLRGLSLAHWYKFFDFDTFNVEEYEHFEQVEVRHEGYIIRLIVILVQYFLIFYVVSPPSYIHIYYMDIYIIPLTYFYPEWRLELDH